MGLSRRERVVCWVVEITTGRNDSYICQSRPISQCLRLRHWNFRRRSGFVGGETLSSAGDGHKRREEHGRDPMTLVNKENRGAPPVRPTLELLSLCSFRWPEKQNRKAQRHKDSCRRINDEVI